MLAWVARADARETSALVRDWSACEREASPPFCSSVCRAASLSAYLAEAASRASVASAWAICARSRATLASAWRSASSYGRASMVNSRSPWATFWPSVKPVRTSSPAICDFTCTMADASTVPTTRSSVGTDSWVALATETGTAGGPPMGRACSRLHPPSASRHALKIRIRICRTDDSPI